MSEIARRILLVEDDLSLGETLSERLTKEGFQCSWERTMKGALERLSTQAFDLIVLDVGLPDGSGFDLAVQFKRDHRKLNLKTSPSTPFLFVTAQTSAEDRLKGYELGAEEYIPKPFHLKEFLLRVNHVIENHVKSHVEVKRKTLGDREIDFESRTIRTSDGKIEFLAAKDFEFLRLLVKESPRVLSRDEILNTVWGEGEFPSTRTIDNCVVRLRQAIGDRDGQVIRSVRGVGYQWLEGEKEKSE
jgi:two-component system, OmpR family, phosphate regulon response regulator PhoB